MTVLLGDGTGAFSNGGTLNVGASPSGVAIADVDGDGAGDILVSNRTDNTVSVLLSNP